MHILFISWWWPYPADNGSKLRIYHLLKQLATRHQVTLLSFAEANEARPEDIAHMQEFCANVVAVPRPHFQPGSMKALMGYASRWPRSLIDTYSPAAAQHVERICKTQAVDCIIASQLDTLRYLDCVPHIPAILEEVEVTQYYDWMEEASRRFRARLTVFKVERMLRATACRDVTMTVVSAKEQALIRSITGSRTRVDVIPNGVDTTITPPTPTPPEPNTLIYPGAVTYHANYNAVRFFINEVLPLLRAKVPDVKFIVTGGTGSVDVSDLAAQPGVHFTGYLPDVVPAIQAAWATVVPLQHGGGTRLKILESMALGTPVISTGKGAEGLDVHPDEDILIADEPQALAAVICSLLGDPAQRSRLAQAGRSLVERQYDWAIIGRQLLELVDEIIEEKVTHG